MFTYIYISFKTRTASNLRVQKGGEDEAQATGMAATRRQLRGLNMFSGAVHTCGTVRLPHCGDSGVKCAAQAIVFINPREIWNGLRLSTLMSHVKNLRSQSDPQEKLRHERQTRR